MFSHGGVVAVSRHAEGLTLETEVDGHPRIVVALAGLAGVGKAVLPKGNVRRDHDVPGAARSEAFRSPESRGSCRSATDRAGHRAFAASLRAIEAGKPVQS
jgi:hypothetical protein